MASSTVNYVGKLQELLSKNKDQSPTYKDSIVYLKTNRHFKIEMSFEWSGQNFKSIKILPFKKESKQEAAKEGLIKLYYHLKNDNEIKTLDLGPDYFDLTQKDLNDYKNDKNQFKLFDNKQSNNQTRSINKSNNKIKSSKNNQHESNDPSKLTTKQSNDLSKLTNKQSNSKYKFNVNSFDSCKKNSLKLSSKKEQLDNIRPNISLNSQKPINSCDGFYAKAPDNTRGFKLRRFSPIKKLESIDLNADNKINELKIESTNELANVNESDFNESEFSEPDLNESEINEEDLNEEDLNEEDLNESDDNESDDNELDDNESNTDEKDNESEINKQDLNELDINKSNQDKIDNTESIIKKSNQDKIDITESIINKSNQDVTDNNESYLEETEYSDYDSYLTDANESMLLYSSNATLDCSNRNLNYRSNKIENLSDPDEDLKDQLIQIIRRYQL